MSQKHSHTECNPSDMHPACPRCESDVFVEARRTRATGYKCQLCGHVWTEKTRGDEFR